MTVFFHALFYSTLVPMFTVLDPLLEFTYHLLFSWRKFALCIQSLLRMLFLFGWPPCQRSDMILMEVSQHAYDMIHYISGLFGYFYVCEIYVNLMWYLYLFMLNKFCLSLSLSLHCILDVYSPLLRQTAQRLIHYLNIYCYWQYILSAQKHAVNAFWSFEYATNDSKSMGPT